MPIGRPGPISRFLLLLCAFSALTLGPGLAMAAMPVGEVVYAQGITSAQQPGEVARFVVKGDAINEGDVISTGPRGFALVEFKDHTKMTLRPNTVFAVDKFSDVPKQESAFFRLLKGGIRTLTGLIGKRNPSAVRIQASTATIGIRGTSFDTRICEADCAQEEQAAKKKAAPPSEPVVARVAVVSGGAAIVGRDGQSRTPVVGTALFDGDTVRTEKDSYVVLAFRDHSKATVIANSEFKLENVQFSGPKADQGSFIVRIVRGGARLLTGFLGHRDPKAVRVNMLTAIIGIRGTGFDNRIELDCAAGPCSDAAFAYTWQGSIAMEGGGRSIVIDAGRAGVFNPTTNRLETLDEVPQFFRDETAPRPDAVPVDFDQLFAIPPVTGVPPGVYVGVREGLVELFGADGSIVLGPGESGYLGAGRTVPERLETYPGFLQDDPTPLPENFNEQSIRPLDTLIPGGAPGSTICEI